jgi:hypothetical protein
MNIEFDNEDVFILGNILGRLMKLRDDLDCHPAGSMLTQEIEEVDGLIADFNEVVTDKIYKIDKGDKNGKRGNILSLVTVDGKPRD